MEFRLTYEGALPAAGSSARLFEKHIIRKAMHEQLKDLWKVHPLLSAFASTSPERHSVIREIARTYRRAGFNFVPLVSKYFGLVCSLDILFLRRENPGHVITQGGDLDNRIKVLFDGLRMPVDAGELPTGADSDFADEFFYCLLEGDALVTEFNVTTDRLLGPLREGEHESDVRLVIKVATRIVDHKVAYVELG